MDGRRPVGTIVKEADFVDRGVFSQPHDEFESEFELGLVSAGFVLDATVNKIQMTGQWVD